MDNFIHVQGNGQRYEVATDDGTVPAATIRSAFLLEADVTVSLHRNNRVMKCNGLKNDVIFDLGPNWKGALFECRWAESVRRRSVTPMAEDDQKEEKTIKLIRLWESRVFKVFGESGLQGSGVLHSGRRVLTAAHLHFKLHQTYSILGSQETHIKATCIFICVELDFAMLSSMELPEVAVNTEFRFGRGDKFFILGYPSGLEKTILSITRGIIEARMDDDIHFVIFVYERHRVLEMRKLVIPKYYGRPSIGLALFGCTNRPFYHVCVFPDKALGRRYEGNILEQVGTFDPLPNQKNEKLVALNFGRLKYWIGERNAHISVPVLELLGLSGLFPIHPKSFIRAKDNRQLIADQQLKEVAEAAEAEKTAEEQASSGATSTSHPQ